MWKNWIERVKKVNLWLIILVVVGLYIAFFGEHNYTEIMELEREIKELKTEIKAMKDSCSIYELKLKQLETDPETFEKIIREQYQMKRPEEDLYIVKEK